MNQVEAGISKDAEQIRAHYARRLAPFVEGVVTDDAYFHDALVDLSPQQRGVFARVVAEDVAINAYGRTKPELLRFKHNPDGSARRVDPVLDRHRRMLRAVGITHPGEHLEMAETLIEVVKTAVYMDPMFDKPLPSGNRS